MLFFVPCGTHLNWKPCSFRVDAAENSACLKRKNIHQAWEPNKSLGVQLCQSRKKHDLHSPVQSQVKVLYLVSATDTLRFLV